MHNSNRLAFFNVYYLIIDILGLILSYWISYAITCEFIDLYNIKEYFWILFLYIPIWLSIMTISGMYNSTTFNYYDRIFKNILLSTAYASILVSASMYAVKQTNFSRLFFFNYFIFSFIIMLMVRYFVLYMVKLPNNKDTIQVMVVGVQEIYDKFDYYVKKTNIKINVIKYVRVDENQYNPLIDIEYFKENLKQEVVDEIYFAVPIKFFKEIQEYVLICEEMGITSRVLLNIGDNGGSRVHVASLGTLPMITFHSISLNNPQLFIKRLMDIIGSLVGLILSSVLWIGAAIAIKIDSPGPIFYSQIRVGRNGREFKVYKFRSMYIDADARRKEIAKQNEMDSNLMFKVKNDPRITKVGKFIRKTSIDELPQFFNVLKGDMSLVGTRPPTIGEVENYESYHWRRISIKPGITGMWQVSGRSSITSFDQVVNLDTSYIDEWSIGLDIKIIIKTIIVVLARRGAN